MILLKNLKNMTLLAHRVRYSYHIEDLMERNYTDRQPIIFLPAFHLYADKILNEEFHEKSYLILLLELDKVVNDSDTNHLPFFEYANKNLHKIKSLETISTIVTSAFNLNFTNKVICTNIIKRGFEVLRLNLDEKTYSYHTMRLFVAINKLIGFEAISNEEYDQVTFNDQKPLFIIFILQMFWKAGLVDKYPFLNKAMETLLEHEPLIPFSDVHHMMFAKKSIKDPRFSELTDRIQSKLKEVSKNVVNEDQKKQKEEFRISLQITNTLYQNYISDLHQKYL